MLYFNHLMSPTSPSLLDFEHLDVIDICRMFGITLPQDRGHHWRKIAPNSGEVRGLPHLGTCILLITDGHHAYVRTAHGSAFKIVLANFDGRVESPRSRINRINVVPRERKTVVRQTTPRQPREATSVAELANRWI